MILDQFGHPIDTARLQENLSEAQLTGMRSIWNHAGIAGSLTPVRLADVLARAQAGDHHDFLTLAEEMEERDPHYGSVLGTRKRAASGINHEVEAADDKDKTALALAEDVREMLAEHDMSALIEDLLDGLGKGYSAVEIMWQTSKKKWWPSGFNHADPRFFRLDQVTGRKLLLISDGQPMGEPLPAFKFLVHTPRIKSGLPIRGALGRLIATSYMCKSWALGDWMSFAEIFGLPIRVGKYPNGATAAEKDTLRRAVANLGSDAAAVMPESMKLELHEVSRSGSTDLFERLCGYLDKQISKGVLGQTMTSDDGSSQAQAKIHNEVRIDILQADLKQIENVINLQLIKPYIDLNYGEQVRYPKFKLPVPEAEDVKLLVEALEKLVPMGLRVEQKTVRDRLGIPDPAPDAELLGVPATPTADAADNTAAKKSPPEQKQSAMAALNFQRSNALLECVALNSEQGDELVALLSELSMGELMRDVIAPLEMALAESDSADEFYDRFAGLAESMGSEALVNSLAESLFKAASLGHLDDLFAD